MLERSVLGGEEGFPFFCVRNVVSMCVLPAVSVCVCCLPLSSNPDSVCCRVSQSLTSW